MSKINRKPIKFSESGFFFDDCPICQAVKKAEEKGKNLSVAELKKVFNKANRKNK